MNLLSKYEQQIANRFSKNGYIIEKIQNLKKFNEIEKLVINLLKKEIKNNMYEVINYKKESIGSQIFENFVKFVSLSEIDKRWKEHLSAMDQMREGINLRAYGQKNPLIEYKKEGFLLFEDMMFYINKEILKNIFRTNLTKVDESKIIVESNIPKNIKLSHNKNLGLNLPNSKNQKKPSIPISNSNPINKKYGRNDKIKISNGSEIKIIKFKKAESLLNQGWSIIE